MSIETNNREFEEGKKNINAKITADLIDNGVNPAALTINWSLSKDRPKVFNAFDVVVTVGTLSASKRLHEIDVDDASDVVEGETWQKIREIVAEVS